MPSTQTLLSSVRFETLYGHHLELVSVRQTCTSAPFALDAKRQRVTDSTSRDTPPAIRSPISSRVAVAGSTSPTILPRNITMIR